MGWSQHRASGRGGEGGVHFFRVRSSVSFTLLCSGANRRCVNLHHLIDSRRRKSFISAWVNAAPTTVLTVRLWTDSPAPDRETRLLPSTAADSTMSSTAATTPTVFSRMSTGTCGGWGTVWWNFLTISDSFLCNCYQNTYKKKKKVSLVAALNRKISL